MNAIKIHSKKISGFRPRNSRFVLAIFWITILFQLTVFKHVWMIESWSRFFNSATLLIVSLYAAHSIIFHRFNKNVWSFYILPGLFVFFGMFLNITLNSINNPNVINYFGMMLPWSTYLAMPALLKKNACDSEILWRYFYYFMLIAVFLGMLDYLLSFYGVSSPRMVLSTRGEMLVGRFAVFNVLEGGRVYYRFYGCFSEPGTLAMFLIPVIAYSYFYKKYIGLAVFVLGLYFSESLGGKIAVAMIIPLLIFASINKRKVPLAISIVVLILVSSVIVISCMDYFTLAYKGKQRSRSVREYGMKNTIINLPSIIVNNPIGFELSEGTAAASKSKYYYGSNFRPGSILQMGGISAFLGYLVVLLVSLVAAFLRIICKNISLEEKVVFSSLIVLFPFIVQRPTVWDSAIFAFLFAPSIIRFLQSRGDVLILSNQPQTGLGVHFQRLANTPDEHANHRR